MKRKKKDDFSAGYRADAWAGSAVKFIKFKDDRERVKHELMAHMSDARDAYIDAGFEPYEAESRAIEAMGDADEVAQRLSDIYRPFWGRLWKITRFFAVWTVVYMIFLFFTAAEGNSWFYDCDTYFEPLYENASDCIVADTGSRDKVHINGYTITLPRAVVLKDQGSMNIWFTIKLTNIDPSLKRPNIIDEIYAVDDCGKRYSPRIMYRELDENDLAGNIVFVSPFKTYYEMWLTGVDERVNEITFCYDRFGQYFELKLPLRGGSND